MRRITAVVVVLALGVMACGGDDDDAATEGAEAPTDPSVDVIALNLLHGIQPECGMVETDFCRATDRLEVLFDLIEAAGCPELIGLGEVARDIQGPLVPERLPALCEGQYELLFDPTNTSDAAILLTSLPIVEEQVVDLAGPEQEAYWAQVESEAGPIDFLTTHLAVTPSLETCEGDACPASCEPGLDLGTCNAREVVAFLDERADPAGITIVGGDLNRPIGDPRIRTLTDEGFRDLWTVGGNAECDPATGEGCTCCITGDSALDGLDLREPTFEERIDFLLARAPDGCDLQVESELFAGTPTEQPVNGVFWPSDHAGVAATLSCRGT